MEGAVHWHKQLPDCSGIWMGEKKKKKNNGINRPGELQFDIKNNMMDSPQWPLALVAGGQGKKKGKQAEKKKKKKARTSNLQPA